MYNGTFCNIGENLKNEIGEKSVWFQLIALGIQDTLNNIWYISVIDLLCTRPMNNKSVKQIRTSVILSVLNIQNDCSGCNVWTNRIV